MTHELYQMGVAESVGHLAVEVARVRRRTDGARAGAPSSSVPEPHYHEAHDGSGGLSTKIHHLCDGKGRPLVLLLGPGQANDSPMFPNLLNAIRVPRLGPGRPRTRPDAVLGDRAYSSRGNQALLRSRGSTAVIAEPSDQAGHRKRKGSKGGRPPTFDADAYKGGTVIERTFNVLKQWRALATRYDKPALTYHGGVVLGAITWLRELGDAP